MRLVPRIAVGSAVSVTSLIGLLALVEISGTMEGAELILIAAVIGLSLPYGVLLGFLAARRIWLKCKPAGSYRKKPAYWLWAIPILVSILGYRALDLLPRFVAFAAMFGWLGVMATVAVGMAVFERKVGCYLSVVGDPAFWSRWVEYRVEWRGNATRDSVEQAPRGEFH
jgi:hypothetical protein